MIDSKTATGRGSYVCRNLVQHWVGTMEKDWFSEKPMLADMIGSSPSNLCTHFRAHIARFSDIHSSAVKW